MHTHTNAELAVWTFNRACGIQVVTHSMRGNTLPTSDEIAKGAARDSLPLSPPHGTGDNVLAALIRSVDRIDGSYRR